MTLSPSWARSQSKLMADTRMEPSAGRSAPRAGAASTRASNVRILVEAGTRGPAESCVGSDVMLFTDSVRMAPVTARVTPSCVTHVSSRP